MSKYSERKERLREMIDENRTWRTSAGKFLTLGQMETQHLKNTARMLRKRAADTKRAYWSVRSMLQGEMAIHSWENAQSQMDEGVCDLNELADAMERVMNKRIAEQLR